MGKRMAHNLKLSLGSLGFKEAVSALLKVKPEGKSVKREKRKKVEKGRTQT